MFGRENVHLISQSSNDLNLTFVVDEAAADGMLPKLHAALIDAGAMPVHEEAVFGPRWREIEGTFRPRPAPWWQAPAERDALLRLAQAGTPRYAYHLPTVRARAAQLKAIAAVDRRYFAVKATRTRTSCARWRTRASGWNACRWARSSACSKRCPISTRSACCSRPASRPSPNTRRRWRAASR